MHGISIHALLAESDGQGLKASTVIDHFYPRSPCGERRQLVHNDAAVRNFYPRSPCGERPEKAGPASCANNISIHALLAESD